MKSGISMKYALRSLARHSRRTLLSVAGIGIGSAVCLFLISFIRGESDMMIRAAAEGGSGHLQVVPSEWPKTRSNDLRLPGWRDKLETVRQDERVRIATPHARKEGLLAFGTRLTGLEIVGVDPTTEQDANRQVQNVTEGRYLNPGEKGAAVVGKAVTDQLDVELEDDLMVTLAGSDGQMKSAMLRIVGIVSTGSRQIDATICHVDLSQLEELTGREGATKLLVLLKSSEQIRADAQALADKLPDDCAVLTWQEFMPELASGVEVDQTWTSLMIGIVVVVVFLGIASAQLAAVLERRREFAVLAALGMKNLQLIRVMVVEGVVLGLLGAALGLAIGVPATYLLATKGFDFAAFVGNEDMVMSNVLLDPIIYGDFGWWLASTSLLISMSATVLSSLYPAWFAVKTDPASALRVEH